MVSSTLKVTGVFLPVITFNSIIVEKMNKRRSIISSPGFIVVAVIVLIGTFVALRLLHH